MKKVLFVVGSLREGSFNRQLAKEAEALLSGKATVDYLDYSQVPLMSQDAEQPVLPAVQEARDAVASADAIWIFSPVYNFAIPGTIKNLLDWLSRSLDPSDPRGASALHEKLVTVSSVGNAGHDPLFTAYRSLLPFIRMQVVEPFVSTTVNDQAWVDGRLVISDEVREALAQQSDALLAAIQ